ncbi:BLUF domain-containing protein [Sphingomonas sp. A2-49]|uniref:BLUF domain-containing protein n=1 Tax=Sphingomonas sp. A2-49 TaxID=1391375 RepID=UPI0021CFC340|nr:BLUF domain-containing protein [Sphingomonas sp. A2-49]MCU6456122.1 BLUF domain-containing protein [Sphingomonas sp. A2-49]
MRQIFYHSRAAERVDVSAIMASSKRNNGMDGITGVLVFDGRTFLQVLEGPEDSVAAAFDRIQADPRHTDVTVISDHAVTERDFAYWSMELRDPSHPSDDAMWRLRRRLEHFDPDLQRYFFDQPSA